MEPHGLLRIWRRTRGEADAAVSGHRRAVLLRLLAGISDVCEKMGFGARRSDRHSMPLEKVKGLFPGGSTGVLTILANKEWRCRGHLSSKTLGTLQRPCGNSQRSRAKAGNSPVNLVHILL
jgi:hypothetical protein